MTIQASVFASYDKIIVIVKMCFFNKRTRKFKPAIFVRINKSVYASWDRNLRSKHVNLSKLGDGNGSFNIASTRGEGEGYGMFMPAVQTNVPQAAKIIKEVLEILHKLYRLIMPLCISRFEWDMIEFNALENNVIAFGGLDPGPTSVQLNASSTANIIDLGVELLEEDEPHPLIDVDTTG
ncbi:hypothetical protein B0H10DRAFT_2231094 [Mycena sp. CBHHK59/15]|nr:hypothetical protein B0H10DRAFT_2231094 [Mycena sp. CBHHK59/15]